MCNLPPPYGGAEVFAKHLVLQLHSASASVAVVTHRSFEIEQAGRVLQYCHKVSDHADLTDRGIAVHPLFRTALRSNPQSATLALRALLLEAIAAERAEAVHCHFTIGCAEAVVDACELADVPLVMTLHGMTNLVPVQGSFVCGPLTADRIIALLNRCTRIVVVSDEMLDYCRRNGVQRLRRIPAGIDMQSYSSANSKERRDVLYVGKLNRIKGLAQTVTAFVRIADQITARLRLVGRGIDSEGFADTGFFLEPAILEQARGLISEGRIQLFGELAPDRLRLFYASCRALALPSMTEGCPLVALEAVASGMVVVASRVGSLPEIICSEGLGYLVAPNDVEALSRALLRSLGENGGESYAARRRVVERYDISGIAQSYHDLFHELCPRA